MARHNGEEIADSEAVRSILSAFDIYEKQCTHVNDSGRWHGLDDPKYPEIARDFEQALFERDSFLDILVNRINEYIDSRIEEAIKNVHS